MLRHRRYLYYLIPLLLLLVCLVVSGYYYYEHTYLEAEVSEAYAFDIPEENIVMSIRETKDVGLDLSVVYKNMVARAARKNDAAGYTFEYSDPSVVRIDSSGKVEPLSVGKCDVTVRYAELSDSFRVTVYMPIDDISLNVHEIVLNTDEEQQLYTVVQPEDATLYEGASYETTNPEIASVTEDGLVHAVYPGQTYIRMRSNGFEDLCMVTVLSPLESIEFLEQEADLVMERGTQYAFGVRYFPEYTTDDRTVRFESSDPSVGTVDASGIFTAVGAGNTVVTASVGEKSVSCNIRVKVTLRNLYFTTGDLVMRSGDAVQIPLAYDPYDFTENPGTVWTTTNANVVAVDPNGVVLAKDAGTAVITATNGALSATMSITVVIPVTGVTLSDPLKTINKGETYQFVASVLPFNTTEDRTIYWSSDDTSVATVDGNGLMTGVGPGTVHIYALHENFSAFCTVTVLSPITNITYEQPEISLMQGASTALNILYEPLDTTDDKTVFFTVEDPAVASVSGNVLTALNPGTTRIIARVGDHYAAASLTVTTHVEVESVLLSSTAVTLGGPGETASVTASVYPENATNSAVAWWSSDPSVATVSGGVIRAVSAGTCIIHATAGDITADCTVTVSAVAQNIVVVLDPGHSAMYPGASYNNCREEELNLKVATYCKSYLESNYSGITVYLTRSDGNPLDPSNNKHDLVARAQFAQNVGASILVSMHFNATTTHTASGCLVFASKEPNVATQSLILGNQILMHISAMGLYNRGVIVTNSNQYFDEFGNPMDYYAINRHCAARGIPGIIVEHCFLDVDVAFLSEPMLQQFGIADAVGIAEYLNLSAK